MLSRPWFLLAGAVLSGAFASAEGNQCIDIQQECVHLGKLNEPIVLAETFESCSKTTVSAQQSSTHDDSSVIYQFEIVNGDPVAFTVDGLGDTVLLNDGNVVFWGGELLTSFSRRFDPGGYTLIGRAPRCANGKDAWEGAFRIQIDPQGAQESKVGTRIEQVDAAAVTSLVEEEPLESRATKWVLGGAISGAVAYLLLGLLLLALGGGA